MRLPKRQVIMGIFELWALGILKGTIILLYEQHLTLPLWQGFSRASVASFPWEIHLKLMMKVNL